MQVATDDWIEIMSNAFLVVVLIVTIPILIVVAISLWVLSLGHLDLWPHFRKHLIRFHDKFA